MAGNNVRREFSVSSVTTVFAFVAGLFCMAWRARSASDGAFGLVSGEEMTTDCCADAKADSTITAKK